MMLDDILAVAETQRIAADLPDAVGYGTDIICDYDLDPLCREEDPLSAIAVVRAVFRRITTPRGGMIDDQEYGFDIQSLIHKAMTPQFEASIPGILRNEILKDERVDSVSIEWKRLGPETFDVSISGVCASGPFNLVLQLNNGDTMLQELAS